MGYFNSGTVQDAAPKISSQQELHDVRLTMTPAPGQTLRDGQEVYLTASGAVSARTTGAQFPFGTVSVGAKQPGQGDGRISVCTILQRDIYGTTTATLAAGSFVRQDGTLNGDNSPAYVAAAPGEYAIGIVLAPAVAGGKVRVGVLRSPLKQ